MMWLLQCEEIDLRFWTAMLSITNGAFDLSTVELFASATFLILSNILRWYHRKRYVVFTTLAKMDVIEASKHLL